MRTHAEVRADIAALQRPPFPPSPTPLALDLWRTAIGQWRAQHPDGDARFEALLAELDAIDVARESSRRAEVALARLGVPERTLRAALSGRDTDARAFSLAWVDSAVPWLVLMGATGVGKSVAAACALLRLVEAGRSCLWVPAAEVATRAGGFDGFAFGLRLKGVEVLVLDDYGTEHGSDYTRSVLSEVLQHRHEDGGRTIVTSNLDGKAFAARLGARLADRVRSACRAREFGGPSLRGGA